MNDLLVAMFPPNSAVTKSTNRYRRQPHSFVGCRVETTVPLHLLRVGAKARFPGSSLQM
jgi:hypothetical protein